MILINKQPVSDIIKPERILINSFDQASNSLEFKVLLAGIAEVNRHANFATANNGLGREKKIAGVLDNCDIFISNLYLLNAVVSQKGCILSKAVASIDIDGLGMASLALDDWKRVAILTSPTQYPEFIEEIQAKGGTDLELRFKLMREAVEIIDKYARITRECLKSYDFARDIQPKLDIQSADNVS